MESYFLYFIGGERNTALATVYCLSRAEILYILDKELLLD